jgi:hypothetical protein
MFDGFPFLYITLAWLEVTIQRPRSAAFDSQFDRVNQASTVGLPWQYKHCHGRYA